MDVLARLERPEIRRGPSPGDALRHPCGCNHPGQTTRSLSIARVDRVAKHVVRDGYRYDITDCLALLHDSNWHKANGVWNANRGRQKKNPKCVIHDLRDVCYTLHLVR